MKKILLLTAFIVAAGCAEQQENQHILEIDKDAGNFSFSQSIKGNWEQVCFFGPYSNNAVAKNTLGFEWDLEGSSRVYHLDGITLAVFTKDSNVINYVEIPRYADFSKFSRKCFSKDNATFNVVPGNVTQLSKNV